MFGLNADAQISVTATAGTPGPTTYATVNAAFTAINAGTHQGAITLSIIGNTTEPATPVPLLKSATPSSYTSVLIRPSGGNWTINSPAAPVASRGILELVGADNVTIDGNDPGTAGVRNLTIQMVATATSGTQCIRLASNSTTGLDGADNNTVKNCILIGGRNSATTTTTSFGILMSNSTASTGGAYGSQSTLIENNLITRCYQGVSAIGSSATYLNPGSIIRNNVMGSAVSADNIGNRGIIISYSASTAGVGSAVIQGNDIRCGENGTTGFGSSVAGVEASTANAGLIIDGNNIHDVRQPSTSGYHAIGIYITGSTSNSGITIRNNFIRDMVSSLYTTSITTTGDTYGVYFSAGATNVNIDNNTIALQVDPTTGTLTNHINACVAATVNGVTIASFRNNILVNTLSSINSYGLYCVATGNISAGAVNNNNYYVPNGKVGYYNAAARTTLGDWQTATGKDGASINYPGPFVSSTDLHVDLSNGNAAFFNGTGATGTGVTTDIDGDTRGNPPDIGADEFILLTCAGADGGTITPAMASACSGGTYVMSSTGVTTGAGISNQWLVSTTSGGPYLPVSGGSGATSASYTTGALATGTYYYVLRNTCTTGPVSDDSNELTLTVNPTPSATATNNGPACVGGSVTFDGVPSTAGTYAWSGPNGYTSALEDPTRTGLVLTDAGIYSFTVTVLGCPSAAATTSVAVINAPTIGSTTATPNPTCFNGSSQLNVVASQPTAANQLAYTYSTGQSLDPMTGATTLVASSIDDTPGATIALPFPVVFNNNTYSYFAASPDGWMVLKTTATAATSQFTNAVTSTTNIPKLYPYWDDLATGSNGSVSYVVTGTTPNRILKVQWFLPIPRNTTGTANSTFQAWVYETSGSVEYRYGTMAAGSMSASVGLTALATNFQSVTVSTNTVSTSTANDANAGQPLSGTMYRFAGSVLSYSWSPSTFIAGQEALPNPVATNVTAASTAYTVTVSNGSCPVTGTVTLTTSAPITAATISGNLSYCEGLSTTLTAVPTDGAGPYSYLWSPGGQVSASIVVTAPGNYNCQVTDNCTGTVNTGSVSVTQNALPAVAVSPNSANYCTGNAAIALTASGAITYAWAPALGLDATTGAVVNASPTATTSYTVTGTDGNGCVNTATSAITVLGALPMITSTTATPGTICPGSSSQLQVNTPGPSAYCAATHTNGCDNGDEYISNVTFGAINVSSTCAQNGPNQYTDNTSTVGSVVANTGTAISVGNPGYFSGDLCRVYVDWNQNGLFTDIGEETILIGTTTFTGTVNTPVNAVNGNTRMRVRLTYTSGMAPCGVASYGETEDYTLAVSGGVDAYTYSWSPATYLSSTTVANPSATAVMGTTAYTVTVTNGAGCSATGSTTITVPTVDDGDVCTLDACASGVVTNIFQDADGDGTCDANDLCPNDPNKIAPGSCGCGMADTDTDSDGTADCNDLCPNDPNKIAPGNCGCGNAEPGATCDDGDPNTTGDVIDANCACVGTPIGSCTGNEAVLRINTDASASQISWEIK
ncbi:MAG: beta strand repeat-containing protein, partial [Flavobacteriales bacterium]